jgi:hypothetical protein
MASCATPSRSQPPPAGHLNRREVIEHLSVAPAEATFLSHNGQWGGTDHDVRISLAKDNQAEVKYFRDAVETYRGTYSIDAIGAIHVSLRSHPAKWPTMYLYTDKQGAFLLPTGNSTMSAYSPFRQTQ